MKQSYKCEYCGRAYSRMVVLIEHRVVAHPLPRLSEDEVFGRFERGKEGSQR